MANTVYMSKTGLIGGEATKLDSIDGAGLVDGDAAFVNVSNVQYIYRLDADSGAAESSPNIIAPDTNAGNKRWILQTMTEASLILSGLTASLPVFTDGSKKLVSKSVADTLTALGVGAWTDYYESSTITGWGTKSGFIYYKVIVDIVFVEFRISGYSNSTSAKFTLPFTPKGAAFVGGIQAMNNGERLSSGGSLYMQPSSTVDLYTDCDWGAWATEGYKEVIGQFFFRLNTIP